MAQDLVFEFYPAHQIDVTMIKNAAVNLEYKLVHEFTIGSHTLFIGEILNGSFNPEIEPLAYFKGKYWELNSPLKKKG